MTLRDAFTQARHGAGTGWLLVRWASHDPCTLDTEAQFRDLAVEPTTKELSLPQELLEAEWTAICESHGLQAVIRRTDELSGTSDDSACLEAMLIYHLAKDHAEDPVSFAADAAVSRRRGIAEPGAAPNGGPAAQLGSSEVSEGPPSVS
jgi:hypothetical protein